MLTPIGDPGVCLSLVCFARVCEGAGFFTRPNCPERRRHVPDNPNPSNPSKSAINIPWSFRSSLSSPDDSAWVRARPPAGKRFTQKPKSASPDSTLNSLTSINRLCRTGFCHHHFAEQWQLRFQLSPNPYGDLLTRRILQTRDIVKMPMIQLLPERAKCLGDVRVIHQPSQFWVTLAGYHNLHFETMPMQSAALVRLRQSRQQMRRFKLK